MERMKEVDVSGDAVFFRLLWAFHCHQSSGFVLRNAMPGDARVCTSTLGQVFHIYFPPKPKEGEETLGGQNRKEVRA